MFVNLRPYLTWLGIMFASKPNDLQNRINTLGRGPTVIVITENVTHPPVSDLCLCSMNMPAGRYAHHGDCSKFCICRGEIEIRKPEKCPESLHFSPTAKVCTVQQDAGCIVNATTPAGNSTTTTESLSHWTEELSKYYKANDENSLAIYYETPNVANPQSLLWPITFTRNIWDKVFMMYGNFGPRNRLYLLLRGKPLAEDLNYSTYLDSDTRNINSIEVGSSDWSVENASNTDLIVQNIAQIVSTTSRGIRYPGPEPYWAEIFVYDLYARSGRLADRDRWAVKVRQESEDNIASIPLFTQWYLVIYQTYGGGSVLNRFLIVREQNFPKAAGDSTAFARVMNRGEFVHFWSGSTGANLTNLASSVFGWSDTLNAQYQRATADFTNLNY